jgi:hypothetical protein
LEAVTIEPPNNKIYEFSGHITVDENGARHTFPLDSSNILLRGCVLRNTERVVGVVCCCWLVYQV